MKLRILHICQSADPVHGGPIEGIYQQAREHQLDGHTVDVVCLDQRESQYIQNDLVDVYPLTINILDRLFPFTLIGWLRTYLHNYDAVIINGVWGFHLFAAWLVLRETNIPYFVFTHGMLDPWFKRRYPLKHIKKWLYWPWAVYPVLRDADSLFFTCKQELLLARQSFWLYDCAESVIDYGTLGIPDIRKDYTSEFLAQHPSLYGKQLFLFLGRVHPKKGPDLLVRSIAHLQAEGLWDPNCMTLVMAGPADSLYARKLVNLAEILHVSGSLYWTGMLTGDQKWGAFQSAEVFVLPSHQENFGIAVAEALSSGTPVLISHSVNIFSEILSDDAGFVDSDDIQGTVRLLRRWIELDPRQRACMSLSARSCFQNRFHISLTSRSIISNIYISILGRLLLQRC